MCRRRGHRQTLDALRDLVLYLREVREERKAIIREGSDKLQRNTKTIPDDGLVDFNPAGVGPEDTVAPGTAGHEGLDSEAALGGDNNDNEPNGGNLDQVLNANLNAGNDNIAPGNALRTEPEAGTEVEPGSDVILLVSAGPAPVAVPELTGLSRADARDALAAAGLVEGDTSRVEDASTRDTVLDQDPAPGTEVAPGSAVDLVLSAADEIIEAGGQIVVTGSGEAQIEQALVNAHRRRPDAIGVVIGFNDAQARRIFAGSDFTLMPSRFEPCGLSQMYAQRFGSLPIGHQTGGLAETIKDGETGFLFPKPSAESFLGGVRRAFDAFRAKDRLDAMRRSAMARSFSWDLSAALYSSLYRKTIAPSIIA